MKRLIIIMILILITSSVLAQGVHEYRFGNNTLKIKKGVPDFDNWSMMHTGGGAVFYYGARKVFKLTEKQALVSTIIAGYVYELYVDGLNNKIGFFDSANSILSSDNGADLKGDPVFTALGGVIACSLDLLFQLKDKRYRLMIKKNELTYSVGLMIPIN